MIHTDSDEGPVPIEVLQFQAAKAKDADLAAAILRAEQAESAAAIWEQRCSQATALSGQHLADLAAAHREWGHLRTRLESAEEALRFYANLENWTPVFCKCQQHPCPMHTDQGWRARAALGAAGEERSEE